MLSRASIPLALGMAAILLAPCALAQTFQDQANAYDNGGYGPAREQGADWGDDARQRQENAYDNGGYSQQRDQGPDWSDDAHQTQANTYNTGRYGPAREQGPDWSDDAHRRDRVDTIRVDARFADNEAGIRSQLDAGLAQGWLDHDDFLIFARQLHQTELREAREQRGYGGAVPERRSALIRAELDELRHQLDDTRRQR